MSQDPLKRMNAANAAVLMQDAEATFQAAIAAANTSYGPPGFVSTANYATYNTAIAAAYTARTATLVTAFALMAN